MLRVRPITKSNGVMTTSPLSLGRSGLLLTKQQDTVSNLTAGTWQFRVGAYTAAGTIVVDTVYCRQLHNRSRHRRFSTASAALILPANTNMNVVLTWGDVTGETYYKIQWSNDNFATIAGTRWVVANQTTSTVYNLTAGTWQFRVGAYTAAGTMWSTPYTVAAP